jgi:hypothetical protein
MRGGVLMSFGYSGGAGYGYGQECGFPFGGLGGSKGLGYGGFCGFDGTRQSFFSLLFSLLNFNVSVLTEGDVAPVVGLLVGVTPQFITVAGGTTPVSYIPISQITLITRVV